MKVGDKTHITDNDSRRILLGVITTVHGVRGEVKLRSFTADPGDITAYGPLQDKSGKAFEITVIGGTKDSLIARIQGITTREMAETLRNTELFVPRNALPPPDEHEYYHEDLHGLKLITETGELIGTLTSMHNFGAGDLAQIRRTSGAEEFLPFTRAIFLSVHFKNGTCTVRLPEIEVAGPEETGFRDNE